MIDFAACAAASPELNFQWSGNRCRIMLTNTGDAPHRFGEVVLFAGTPGCPASTRFYGEGYSMLSQYQGTLERFESLTPYSDAGHYRLPRKEGFFSCYNLWLLFPAGEPVQLAGFSSCRRFSGKFHFNPERFEAVLELEQLELAPGETVELEEFFTASGPDRETLLAEFSARLAANHPRPGWNGPQPAGWCSWYSYGPEVTERDIFENLAAIRASLPELRFIQIDDGYQAKMGDWLTPHPNFPAGVRSLCERVREAGFEPALWVAPFIAEADSELFREHPEFFVRNEAGEPLSSGDCSFGGWRNGPWYMLDGSHPGACAWLREVFRVMRREWGCRYFKLDANVWGGFPFGRRHGAVTSVEAYRSGMAAIRDGAGEGAFILGCNAPMWPSLGCCDGMRVTGDINRNWKTFRMLAAECFRRNWQHGRLWLNDPDCAVLTNQNGSALTPAEFGFHAAHLLASGGLVLSGDKIPELDGAACDTLRRLIRLAGAPARFLDPEFRTAVAERDGRTLYFFFNPGDAGVDFLSPLRVRLAAHSACVIEK